ncbi:DUF5320 domain-containing protein [Planctomycetota bacterium]
MPGGNRTGPMGGGPMTGRGAGFCSGSSQPGYASQGVGRGFGNGRGQMGRGRRNRFFAGGFPGWGRTGTAAAVAMNPDQEKEMLQQQVRNLQNSLEAIQSRINDLDGDPS